MSEIAPNSFGNKLQLKVALVNDYRARQPFSLKTRHGIAIVLAFYGDNEEVSEFMQAASHTTRAYIVNANGLIGFLAPSIIEILKKAVVDKELGEVTK